MRRFTEFVAETIVPSILGGFFGALTLGVLYLAVARYAGEIETAISPVIAFGPVTDIYRDEIKACFALHITKLHAAVPLKYAFEVEAYLSNPINVAAYLADADHRRRPNSDLETHPIGQKWTRYYCFEIPQTITDAQDMRVTGMALHRRHPLWKTPTPVPEFTIPHPPS